MAKLALKPRPKMNKREIDKNILEILLLEERISADSKRLGELKKTMTGLYILPPNEKEIVAGIKTFMEKIPVDNGRNNYSVDAMRPFLKAVGALDLIRKIEMLDVAGVLKLVKDGKIPETVLDTCRQSKFTFRTSFGRNEAATQRREQGAK